METNKLNKTIAYGLKLAVFNFFIVALVGTLMRYKMLFPLDLFVHKNLVDAHSHFAFYGWITAAIYLLVVADLKLRIPTLKLKKYFVVCIINLIGAYGMLASFTYNDYYWLSIVFSSVTLFCGWAFLWMLYVDVKRHKSIVSKWYLGALLFAFISSAGVFYLGYMSASKQINTQSLHASIYFYLHFQYNGFYIFTCIGLLLSQLERFKILISEKLNKLIYNTLFVSCLLGYVLSILWLKLPTWLFALGVLGTLIQSYGTILLIQFLRKNWTKIKTSLGSFQTFVLIYTGSAFIIKTILQQISIIPSLAQYATAYRPVAIAYLHLILLMGIATFLLNLLIHSMHLKFSKKGMIAMQLFMLLTFFNQFFLGVEGFGSILRVHVSVQEVLFVIGFLLVAVLLFIFSQLKVNSGKA